MSGSQCSLLLPVFALFTGATLLPMPTPTIPSILTRSPTLNHLNKTFNFENTKETTDKNTTAHCSVPMLKRPSDEAGQPS